MVCEDRRSAPPSPIQRWLALSTASIVQFQAPRPNALWVADFTYVATWTASSTSPSSSMRSPAGSSLAGVAHRAASFVLDALEQALHERRPVRGAGSCITRIVGRNTSLCGTRTAAEAGVQPSVGSVGDSYDNALAETINGLFKAEVIHRRGPWRSFEAEELAIPSNGSTGSNHRRLLSRSETCLPPRPKRANLLRPRHKPGRLTQTIMCLRETRGGSVRFTDERATSSRRRPSTACSRPRT